MPRQRNCVVVASFASLVSGSIMAAAVSPSQAAASGLGYVYGVTETCDAPPDAVFDAFISKIGKLEAVCDAQNAAMERKGAFACPPSTCLSEFKPGDTKPPELSVDVTYSDNVSGQVGGAATSASQYIAGGGEMTSGSISGGVQSTRGRPSTRGLVVRVGLTVSLGRNPDQLTCVNPIGLVMRIMEITKDGNAACGGL